MMPACTGLPPGELMSSTTACEPESSKALRMAATTNSALASAPAAISPLMSTTAVWGVDLLTVAASRCSTTQAMAMAKTSQARREKVRQRRAERCSDSVEKTSFSSTPRSQPGRSATAAAGFATFSGAPCAHRSGVGDGFSAGPVGSVRVGSVMNQNSTGWRWGAVCQRTMPPLSERAIFTSPPRQGPPTQWPLSGR